MTAFAYDVAGRRLAVTNAFGISGIATTNFYGYDANGNQTTFTDSLGRLTTTVYDVLNRQVQVLYADGTAAGTAYDADGRKVAATNQDGVVTQFGYDGAGRLVSVTNAQQMVTRYQYDQAGNELAQIDALGRTNTFAYDGMGRRTLHTLPSGSSPETFGYDADGNLINHNDFNGNAIQNYYDPMNRLTNIYSTGDFNISYSYTPSGQRASMSSSDPYNNSHSSSWIDTVCAYAYDSRNRLIQKAMSWVGGPTASLNYGYDANGNVTNLRSGYANGVNLAYGYDALNRLTNVLSHGQLAAGYGYDPAGNLQAMRYGNGVTNLYQYDSLNRLTNLAWQAGSSPVALFAYRLMAGGTRTNLVETVTNTSRTYQWSYDWLYRMTNENIQSLGNVGYAYDPVGNRTNRQSGGISQLSTSSYGYNTNDELVSDSYGIYSSGNYDGNGNTTGAGGTTYAYDAMNQLTGINGCTNYGYDGDGNRVAKLYYDFQYNAITTFYMVDDRNPSGYPQVVEEYLTDTNLANTPVLSRVYNYGLALISQQQFDGGTLLPTTNSYYGYDGHGSVRFLMDTNGTITDTYTYDAFGTLLVHNGNTPNNYLYAGQQFNPELGLYYNRARYLNQDIGRFWTRDTYEGDNEDPLSLHRYLYAQDNPLDNTDPSGLEVSVYTHIVFHFAPIWRHANIRLYPDNTKDIPNDLLEGQQWQTDPKDARLYITIGAGNDDDFFALTTHINRPLDLATGPHKNHLQFVVPAPGGLSNDQFILEILEAEQTYMDTASNDVVYFTFPIMVPDSYNSNSYVVGLLYSVTGVNYSKRLPFTAAGRGRPVPSDYFIPYGGFSTDVDPISVGY